MYKARVRFLWFEPGQLIDPKDVDDSWIEKKHVELATKKVDKPEIVEEVKEEPESKFVCEKGGCKIEKPHEHEDAGVLDLNKDGKVDGKDVSSLIDKIRGKKKSKKKGGKK